MKIIDLSGYMFSGKSALSDILREFEGVYVPNYLEEFDLLRMPGGLIDLKNSVLDWSPVRSYGAVCRFDDLVEKIASSPAFPAKLYKNGYGYSKRYPNILTLKNEFLKSIKCVEWETPWPYADIDDGPLDTFFRKILSKFSISKSRKYCLIDKNNFIESARKFIQSLLSDGACNNQSGIYVTHNALEPFSPGNNLDLLGSDALSIIVDRDPRDIYATAISTQIGFNEDVSLYRRIAGAHNLNIFIERYLTYRQNVDLNNPRVLRLNFSDLILNYDQAIKRITSFIGLEPKHHIFKKSNFNPEQSKKNIDIWKRDEMKIYSEDFVRINLECNA